MSLNQTNDNRSDNTTNQLMVRNIEQPSTEGSDQNNVRELGETGDEDQELVSTL